MSSSKIYLELRIYLYIYAVDSSLNFARTLWLSEDIPTFGRDVGEKGILASTGLGLTGLFDLGDIFNYCTMLRF